MDSGGSREGAQGAQAPLLFLDQTDEALTHSLLEILPKNAFWS